MDDRAYSLFSRHLDLAPLKGRPAGLVRCCFHQPDRHPSLSVDLEGGVFHCFACGAQGGLRDFAEAVGEVWDQRAEPRLPPVPLERAEKQTRQQVPSGSTSEADEIWSTLQEAAKRSRAVCRAARELATALGPDHPKSWPLLEKAARMETEANLIESRLDDLEVRRATSP